MRCPLSENLFMVKFIFCEKSSSERINVFRVGNMNQDMGQSGNQLGNWLNDNDRVKMLIMLLDGLLIAY